MDAPLPPKAGSLARTHCRVTGHTGDWTYPDGQCVRTGTSRQHGASKSAGATGAARLNHASSTALDRGATPASTTRASSPPAVAAARRRVPPTPDQSGNPADPVPARSMTTPARQGPTALAVHAGPVDGGTTR